jgi:hypothetical protein
VGEEGHWVSPFKSGAQGVSFIIVVGRNVVRVAGYEEGDFRMSRMRNPAPPKYFCRSFVQGQMNRAAICPFAQQIAPQSLTPGSP